jgi:hypothetical protein
MLCPVLAWLDMVPGSACDRTSLVADTSGLLHEQGLSGGDNGGFGAPTNDL